MEALTIVLIVCLIVIAVILFLYVAYCIWYSWKPRDVDLKGLVPVGNLAWKDYLGSWYEHARIDSWFERGLDRVTATYERNPDGTLSVKNCGTPVGSSAETCRGATAWPTAQPGVLQVSFFPFVTAPYVVLGAERSASDPSGPYQRAVVGTPDRKYLWLLSREKEVHPEDTALLNRAATTNNFDPTQTISVRV